MNTLFEPSLLFISEADWYDEVKQDMFLDYLISHLELIDNYDICKIWWTDELQTILVGNPNMHPWFQSDLKNPLIVAIHQKFYNRTENVFEFDKVCQISPSLKVTYANQEAHNHFLKLTHTLIDFNESSYLCVGKQNMLRINESYDFTCTCHNNNFASVLINEADTWLQYVHVVNKFFPTTIALFDHNFEKGLDLVRKKMFNSQPYLFDFEFTPKFKKSIISRLTFQESIFIAIVKKLVSTSGEAANSDLHDEFITKNRLNQWRIRVTQRPSSTRIHYTVDTENKITFLSYYGEGEHDDAL